MRGFLAHLAWLLPATLTAVGVAALSYGLLTAVAGLPRDTASADAGVPTTPSVAVASPPAPVDTPPPAAETPTLTVEPALPGQSASPRPDGPLPPSEPPAPTPTVKPPKDDGRKGVATRVRFPALEIDLPIVPSDLNVRGNPDFYPLCDVAMYMPEFVNPGADGTTYIFAHAQRGMFLPLLRASEVNNGAALVGATVEVYTSDGQLHVYEVTRVKRHARDLSLAVVAPGEHRLVLQTSEGPTGTVPKLQIAARPVSVARVNLNAAVPRPRPRVCAPG